MEPLAPLKLLLRPAHLSLRSDRPIEKDQLYAGLFFFYKRL